MYKITSSKIRYSLCTRKQTVQLVTIYVQDNKQ